MTDEPLKMEMVFAFDDQSESFVLGFELGEIWRQIDGEGCLEFDRGIEDGFPVHTVNIETLRRMCLARGYNLETKATDVEGWTSARLKYVGTGNAKPRLKLVS